jgi:hypothetical protein
MIIAEAMMLTQVFLSAFLLFALLVLIPRRASAHCDTEDGPTVSDGRIALHTGNINHALKWIMPGGEARLRPILEEAIKVRALEGEAAELADSMTPGAERPKPATLSTPIGCRGDFGSTQSAICMPQRERQGARTSAASLSIPAALPRAALSVYGARSSATTHPRASAATTATPNRPKGPAASQP